jgi:hypothetical protein
MTIDDFVNGLFDLKYDKHPGVATKKYLIKCDADFIEQPKGSQNFPDFDPVENIFKEGKCCFRIEEKSNKKHGIHVKPMYNGHIVERIEISSQVKCGICFYSTTTFYNYAYQ